MTEHVFDTDGNDTPIFVRGVTGGFKKNQPSLKIGSSRGSLESPEICLKGDQLGTLKFNAYTGAEGEPYANAGFVSAVVNEDIVEGQKTVNADLILGCVNGIFTGEYVSVNEKGVLSAKGIKIEHTEHPVAQRDKTTDWWLAGGTDYDYPVPITINTTSTGILIAQVGNFKQPAMRFDSYDNNALKAGWTAFNRYRGTPDNPQALQDGDFIYAFDWMGKADDTSPWEWGMAQTAIVDGTPTAGYLPTSLNWVIRQEAFSKPEVCVKISGTGKLYANFGTVVNKDLEINLDAVNKQDINFDDVEFIKVKVNGEYRAIPAYSISG